MLRIEKEWLIIFLIVLIVGFTFRNGKDAYETGEEN